MIHQKDIYKPGHFTEGRATDGNGQYQMPFQEYAFPPGGSDPVDATGQHLINFPGIEYRGVYFNHRPISEQLPMTFKSLKLDIRDPEVQKRNDQTVRDQNKTRELKDVDRESLENAIISYN